MKILDQSNDPSAFESIANSDKDFAIAIGNFDGLHLGHKSLISHNISTAKSRGFVPSALVFHPTPRAFFQSKGSILEADQNIFTFDQKIRGLAELGIDQLFIKYFDEAFASLEPKDFVSQFLAKTLRARHVVVGENFQFGRGRRGTVSELRCLSQDNGISVDVVSLKSSVDGQTTSSSVIREALTHGDLHLAVRHLGHPFILEGTSQQGDQLGRTIGIPTINISGIKQILPRDGVYWGHLWIGDEDTSKNPQVTKLDKAAMPAVFSFGRRPSLQLSPEYRVEAHVLNWQPNKIGHYHLPVAIYLQGYIRPQRSFDSLEALKVAIADDIEQWGKTSRN